MNAAHASRQLHEASQLRNLDRQKFIERLSYHYEQFNFIHPFREGNGRAQRVFWVNVARRAGWQLDWRNVTGRMNDRACRYAAAQGDLTPLYELYELFDLVVSDSDPAAKSASDVMLDMTHPNNPETDA